MTKLKVLYYAARTLISPRKIEVVLKLGDALCHLPAFEKAAGQALREPELNSVMVNRYLGHHPPLNDLRSFPEGSLGREYAKFLEKNSLTPYAQFSPKPAVHRHGEYLKERARYLHDIAHVVLGLSTEVEDEAALNAFLLAQVASPISAIIVAGYILRAALSDPLTLPSMIDKISALWQKGRNCRPFLGMRWEEYWHAPLGELRMVLLKPLPSLPHGSS